MFLLLPSGISASPLARWPRMETARSYYSHHNLELKDADTFYFGEAWSLK
ncbi:MAG TPA: hypothetical protein VK968_08330 [Roseimicrobium sp.]|nr:hypothetical protein [Roseimicrobium sp.]